MVSRLMNMVSPTMNSKHHTILPNTTPQTTTSLHSNKLKVATLTIAKVLLPMTTMGIKAITMETIQKM